MAIKRPELINNEIYHIIVRGVGDSIIFKNKEDRYRAIFSLYEFNTTSPVVIKEKRRARKEQLIKAVRFTNSDSLNNFNKRKNLLLVENLAFCFMPNHVHLLLRQLKKNGISIFMKKFGIGFVNYFNKKYNRRGHLFQGRFGAIHIKNNEQLKNAFVYIHANPTSLVEPKWKEKGISDIKTAIKFLENYQWSSYPDYIGKQNFPSLTEREFLLRVMDGQKGCKDFVDGWIKHKGNIYQPSKTVSTQEQATI